MQIVVIEAVVVTIINIFILAVLVAFYFRGGSFVVAQLITFFVWHFTLYEVFMQLLKHQMPIVSALNQCILSNHVCSIHCTYKLLFHKQHYLFNIPELMLSFAVACQNTICVPVCLRYSQFLWFLLPIKSICHSSLAKALIFYQYVLVYR